MVVEDTSAYQLFAGKNWEYQMKCRRDFQQYDWPYQMKPVDPNDQSGGIFKSLRSFIVSNFSDAMDNVKFVLTNSGLEIHDCQGKGAKFVT